MTNSRSQSIKEEAKTRIEYKKKERVVNRLYLGVLGVFFFLSFMTSSTISNYEFSNKDELEKTHNLDEEYPDENILEIFAFN